MVYWLGLTGSIGSGKSTVAEMLAKRGFPVVDADQLARQAIGPGSKGESEVIKTFGQTLKGPDGHLDRSQLAAVVFSEPKKLKRLEEIVHPLVQELTKKNRNELQKMGTHIAFYDVPLLYEKKMEGQFDAVVVVHADLETSMQRVMKRSNWAREQVEARIRNQLAIEEKIKKSHWTIRNSGSLRDLEMELENILHDIGRKFPKSS